MFLLLGVTAAAVVLQELKLEPGLKRSKTLASQLDALGVKPGDIKGIASRLTERHPQVPSDRSLSGEPGLW